MKTVAGANAAQYTYDGLGNRVQAVRGSTTTRYVYDLAGNLLAETNASNVITRYYIYGLGLLALVDSTDHVVNYHFDGTGNTVALTDSAQNIIKAYAYEPYGKITDEQGGGTQPFTYVGQYGIMRESGSNFYYMRARYYDPEAGRFISEDPSGFSDGVNLYNYVHNNPISFIDPLGLGTERAYHDNFKNAFWDETWSDLTAPNWRTVGIGTGTAAAGVGIIYGSAVTGAAATAVTGGVGFAPSVYRAGQGITMGIVVTAIGIGDIVNGFTGNESITASTLQELYLAMPSEVTATNPF